MLENKVPVDHECSCLLMVLLVERALGGSSARAETFLANHNHITNRVDTLEDFYKTSYV